MENVLCLGDCLNVEELKSFYVRLKYNKDNDDFEEFYFHVVDGVEYELPINYRINGQTIQLKSLTNVKDLLTLKISLQELNKRAEANNKTLLSYVGKNLNLEKIFCVSCNDCGTKYNRYMRFFSGCKVCCALNQTKSHECFVSQAKEIHHDDYDYSFDIYKKRNVKFKILCNTCKNFFFQTPKNHITDKCGCPFCNESKGERRVRYFLQQNNIFFIKQHTFENCKNVKSLKFDFYLPHLNKIIEYDGEGHYFAIFGTTIEDKQFNLKNIKRNDKIKDEFTVVENISMLRIPYWDIDRIDEILTEYLLDHIIENDKQLEM